MAARRALLIGGTRNLGPDIATALLEAGYSVTAFHRGVTNPEILPAAVERVYGDRSDEAALARVRGDFDAVVDTTLYTGADGEKTARTLGGRVGRYVMLSTGQVYLVRVGPARPFREEDYDGPLMQAPPAENAFDFENWSYGIHKREAEDALRGADFPLTVLRLPMVNSERDHHHRLRRYLGRVRAGLPVLIPDGPHLPLRHIYGKDAVRAVLRALEANIDGAFNAGQDETVTIDEFLGKIGATVRREPAAELWAKGLLPDCSPFSEPWMSSLDNSLGKKVLGLRYTPFDEYLQALLRQALGEEEFGGGAANRESRR
ncbi:MAG: epimerase [Acidobacteria bacterium]|nr:epimerase [Acidobacteriota bacterium]